MLSKSWRTRSFGERKVSERKISMVHSLFHQRGESLENCLCLMLFNQSMHLKGTLSMPVFPSDLEVVESVAVS